MPSCPPPNFAALRRECYKVTFKDDDLETTHVPFSSLKEGDYFTLEAAKTRGVQTDMLVGRPICERLFKATSDPYMSKPVDGEWLIDCERM